MSPVFWNLTIAILVIGMATAGAPASNDWWLMMALLAVASAGLVAGHALIGRVSARSFALLALAAALLTGEHILPSSNAVAIAAALLATLVWVSTRRRTTTGAGDDRTQCPACERSALDWFGGPDRRGWRYTRCPACHTRLRTGWPAHAGVLPLATALAVMPFLEDRLLAAGLVVAGMAALGVTRLVWPDWQALPDHRSQ